MIMEGLKTEDGEKVIDYTSPAVLLAAGLGTSIDAFAVGISFALLNARIWISGIIIGTVTFLSSMTAIRIGKSAGKKLGNKVEILGGIVLIAIGIKIFVNTPCNIRGDCLFLLLNTAISVNPAERKVHRLHQILTDPRAYDI